MHAVFTARCELCNSDFNIPHGGANDRRARLQRKKHVSLTSSAASCLRILDNCSKRQLQDSDTLRWEIKTKKILFFPFKNTFFCWWMVASLGVLLRFRQYPVSLIANIKATNYRNRDADIFSPSIYNFLDPLPLLFLSPLFLFSFLLFVLCVCVFFLGCFFNTVVLVMVCLVLCGAGAVFVLFLIFQHFFLLLS